MADEDTVHTNGNGHEENGHVPEIELIIKVRIFTKKIIFIDNFLYEKFQLVVKVHYILFI